MKIVVVDDHALFRKALICILNQSKKINSIFEAANYQELRRILTEEDPDLIILDLELPDMDGIEICELLLREKARQKILVLTMYDSDELLGKLISLGANGYLIKNSEPKEILEAIDVLSREEIYYDKKVVDILRKMVIKNTSQTPDIRSTLTSRELSVLRFICKEYTSQQIAAELSLSIRAVEKIRSSLIKKTDSKNVIGLIKFAYHNKLLVLPK